MWHKLSSVAYVGAMEMPRHSAVPRKVKGQAREQRLTRNLSLTLDVRKYCVLLQFYRDCAFPAREPPVQWRRKVRRSDIMHTRVSIDTFCSQISYHRRSADLNGHDRILQNLLSTTNTSTPEHAKIRSSWYEEVSLAVRAVF